MSPIAIVILRRAGISHGLERIIAEYLALSALKLFEGSIGFHYWYSWGARRQITVTTGWSLYELYRTLEPSTRRPLASAALTGLSGCERCRMFVAMLDWTQCSSVKRVPGKVSGAWVFKTTRVSVRALFENLEDGATVNDFLTWLPGVAREQVEAVLEHAERSVAGGVCCGRAVNGRSSPRADLAFGALRNAKCGLAPG
jgi:uncharacterized protein (DUF433 family)